MYECVPRNAFIAFVVHYPSSSDANSDAISAAIAAVAGSMHVCVYVWIWYDFEVVWINTIVEIYSIHEIFGAALAYQFHQATLSAAYAVYWFMLVLSSSFMSDSYARTLNMFQANLSTEYTTRTLKLWRNRLFVVVVISVAVLFFYCRCCRPVFRLFQKSPELIEFLFYMYLFAYVFLKYYAFIRWACKRLLQQWKQCMMESTMYVYEEYAKVPPLNAMQWKMSNRLHFIYVPTVCSTNYVYKTKVLMWSSTENKLETKTFVLCYCDRGKYYHRKYAFQCSWSGYARKRTKICMQICTKNHDSWWWRDDFVQRLEDRSLRDFFKSCGMPPNSIRPQINDIAHEYNYFSNFHFRLMGFPFAIVHTTLEWKQARLDSAGYHMFHTSKQFRSSLDYQLAPMLHHRSTIHALAQHS